MTQIASAGSDNARDDFDPGIWCTLDFSRRRELLASVIAGRLEKIPGVRSVSIEPGPIGREYDLTAVVETDVGRIRSALWSHARSAIFCDSSIHEANRRQLSPLAAAEDAAHRLALRVAVPYTLESRGLTVRQEIEAGVTRTWTAEHSRFRKRTAVTREDVVDAAQDLDVRDLLIHFHTGPSMRLVSADGEAFMLPEASEVEGELVTLCRACSRWSEGGLESCAGCGSAAIEVVIAARPPRR